MSSAVVIRDETLGGKLSAERVIDFLTDRVSVRELIRSRVYQEVQDYNTRRPETFQGLVQPEQAEAALNGFSMKKPRAIDWKAQFEAAVEAFERGQVLVLADDQQLDDLDAEIVLRPSTPDLRGTTVTFLKLTPLVGG